MKASLLLPTHILSTSACFAKYLKYDHDGLMNLVYPLPTTHFMGTSWVA